jgi:hypothetical protein
MHTEQGAVSEAFKPKENDQHKGSENIRLNLAVYGQWNILL